MRTKEEKEKLNKKYGNEALNAPLSITEITKKAKEDVIKFLKNSDKEIMFIDTDSIWYKNIK